MLTKFWQKSGGKSLCPGNNKLLNFICKKEELLEQWWQSIIIPTYKKGNETYCSNYGGLSWLSTTYKILSSIYISRSARYVDEITCILSVELHVPNQLLVHFAYIRHGGKNGNSTEMYTSYLRTSTRPMVQFGGRFCIIFSLSLLPPWHCKYWNWIICV